MMVSNMTMLNSPTSTYTPDANTQVVNVAAVGTRQGQSVQAIDGMPSMQGGGATGIVPPAETARTAVAKAERTRGAIELEPGSYATVFEPYAFAELLLYFASSMVRLRRASGPLPPALGGTVALTAYTPPGTASARTKLYSVVACSAKRAR